MAYIDKYCERAIEVAKEIEPSIIIDNGINWIWACGFKQKEDAEKFDKFCCDNGCETRGVYAPFRKDTTWSVRFR